MSRLQRKNNIKDIDFKGCGDIFDAFDDAIKYYFRINDDEYDYIAEKATDEELELILNKAQDNLSFTDKKKILNIVDKYLDDQKRVS